MTSFLAKHDNYLVLYDLTLNLFFDINPIAYAGKCHIYDALFHLRFNPQHNLWIVVFDVIDCCC